ncbi:hypothetical protein K5X82_07425 [Halosquirtibacter xylanolyticus]|uniref:hypothetical protein n=1 Tax=Halosquirtibacter xylanolyticus TaxID=3374599 RepID=UPI0037482E1D|nr:hypothetical protein K5X82_07425 [Prolixibacteraceae bacterium]
MSELGIQLIGVAFAALLGAFGWMINIQLKHNKEFAVSLNQLSVAIQDLSKTIAVLETRDKAREERTNNDSHQVMKRLDRLEKTVSRIQINQNVGA